MADHYSEAQAAVLLGIPRSTLGLQRRTGKIVDAARAPYVGPKRTREPALYSKGFIDRLVEDGDPTPLWKD